MNIGNCHYSLNRNYLPSPHISLNIVYNVRRRCQIFILWRFVTVPDIGIYLRNHGLHLVICTSRVDKIGFGYYDGFRFDSLLVPLTVLRSHWWSPIQGRRLHSDSDVCELPLPVLYPFKPGLYANPYQGHAGNRIGTATRTGAGECGRARVAQPDPREPAGRRAKKEERWTMNEANILREAECDGACVRVITECECGGLLPSPHQISIPGLHLVVKRFSSPLVYFWDLARPVWWPFEFSLASVEVASPFCRCCGDAAVSSMLLKFFCDWERNWSSFRFLQFFLRWRHLVVW